MAGNFDGDDPASDTSWYELVDGFQDGAETSASSDSQVDWSESDSGSDGEDGSGGELSNGGSGEDDDAAAHWTARNDDVDAPPFTGRSGLQVEPPLEKTPLSFFKLFFTQAVVDLLVAETNRYATQTGGNPHRRRSRLRSWVPIDQKSLYVFLGLYFLMGVARRPQIAMYWSREPLVGCPAFGRAMSRNRWELILKCLHFADNTHYTREEPLFKVRPLLDLLVENFKTVYVPGRELSVDEELLKWRGRLSFRQYIPSKRARFGMKSFFLCGSNGYLHNVLVYTGKRTQLNEEYVHAVGKSGAVVLQLMQGMLNEGRRLYVDNWYTSLPLCKYLLERNTRMCGTVRRNRKGLPGAVIRAKPQKGAFVHRRRGSIMVLKYNDKRPVLMMSSMHKAEMADTGKRDRQGVVIRKPSVICDYNKHMGGVDRNDELLGFYTSLRKTLKWYKKLAFHLIEECILNAYIVYTETPGTTRMRLLKFRVELAKALLREGGAGNAIHHLEAVTDRLQGRHFPETIPPTGQKAKPQRKCVICRREGFRKETIYRCGICADHPALCAAPCFMIYHTRTFLD